MEFLKEEIVNLLIGKGDATVSNKVREVLNERKFVKFCEEIPEVIERRVLYPTENEEYFKELHSFCLSNKVVARFVTSFISTSGESVVFLGQKFSEDFVAQYPQYRMFKKRVEELLEKMASTIQLEIRSRGLFTEEKEVALFNAQKSKEISEAQHNLETSVECLGNQMHEVSKGLSKITKHLESESDKNISSVLSIGQLTDDTEYAIEVKKIETEVQQKLHFKEAIVKYNELITDIKENVKNPNELLTHIYINLALCYANEEEYVRANRSLEYAQKYCDWEKNAKYYYVKGYICWKENRDSIDVAIDFLNKAICLDPKHIHARMLRCQLGSFVGEEKEKIIEASSECVSR